LRAKWVVGVCVALLYFQAQAAEKVRLYTDIESFTYTEPMAIDGFVDHFSGKLGRGNTALTHNRFEYGVEYDHFRIAKIQRYDFQIRFSPDTALLNYLTENGLPVDRTRAYHIRLRAEHLRSDGFKLGYRFAVRDNLSIDVAASWLESRQFYSGEIRADISQGNYSDQALDEINALVDEFRGMEDVKYDDIRPYADRLNSASRQLRDVINSANGDLQADYYYYKPALREDEIDRFNGVDFSAPNGAGVTFDVRVHWNYSDALAFDVRVDDLWSRIHWKGAPHTKGHADLRAAANDALDQFDRFIENDVIRRSDGNFFTPINPNDPDDPAAALPGVREKIVADNAPLAVRNTDFNQRLPLRATLAADYRIVQNFNVVTEVFYTEAITLSTMGVRLWDHLTLRYGLETYAKGIAFDSRFFHVGVSMDQSDYTRAKAIALDVGFAAEF
jgi:hypothetical protein